METVNTITAGDQKPDIEMALSDADNEATFTGVTANQVRIMAEQDGLLVIDDAVDTIVVATDGLSAIVRRAWGDGETDTPGRMWVTALVTWAGGHQQTFPSDGPLRLDIVQRPGQD